MIWTVETKDRIYIVEAEDQWGAFDALRYLEPEKFGLLVVAKRQFAKDGDEIPVRISKLFGTRWGRPDIAHLFIARAILEGLSDTTHNDCPEEAAR